MQYLHILVAASCANVGSKTLISLNDVPKSTFAAAAAKPLNGMTLSNLRQQRLVTFMSPHQTRTILPAALLHTAA
jgi:hypothetical protein